MKNHVSAIIPMYNASNHIENCLEAVSRQTMTGLEVILVDDCSEDDTVHRARRFPFKIIRLEERQRPAKVRNRGARSSSGGILVFLDSDVVLQPDSIEKIASRVSSSGIDAVSGTYAERIPHANFASQFQNLLMIYEFSRPPRLMRCLFSCFCAIRRDAFEAVGGYREELDFCEDAELGYRLVKAGYRHRLDTDLKVTHLKHYDHHGVLRDHFRKIVTVGAYYRQTRFRELLKNDAIPLGMKIAAASSLLILLSAGLVGISFIPLLTSLTIYSVSMTPFLIFLNRARNPLFTAQAYAAAFEIFLTTQFGLVYGILKGDKND
ncbi:MAG: glycosyltransferase [Candidatus Omnitrophica bacterium]|nr:glycosyltransferase [Candidatus Omnitrophota bacterium]